MSGVPHVPNEAQLLAEFGFVRRLALSLVRDPHLADDLAQQTYVVALEGRTMPHGPLRAWLAGIVRNLAKMSWRSGERRTKREHVAARLEPVPSAAEDAARLEAQEHLVRAVRGLPEPMRATVVLRYLENLSLPTIAERMDISVRAVESRLRRARALLREKLTEAYGDRKAWLPTLCVIAGVKPPVTAAAVGTAVGAAGTGVLIMSVKVKLVLAALALLLISAFSIQALWPVAADSGLPAPDEPEVVPVVERTSGAEVEPDEAVAESGTRPMAKRSETSVPLDASLQGVVCDAEGNPVPGATLSIRATGKGPVNCGVVTDGAGRFEATAMPAVQVRVSYRPGGARSLERVVALKSGVNEVRFDLPPWEKLTVLVVDPVNRPVEGARIQLFQKPGNAVDARTRADGTALFLLEHGFRNLNVVFSDRERREQYMPARVRERPKEGRLRVQLRESDYAEGTVHDAEGKPVPRAFVDVLVEEEQVSYGVCDADGKFRVPYPRGSTITLVARGSQFGVKGPHKDLLARGRLDGVTAASKDVVVPMVPVDRDRTLTCEVRGPRGEPVPGAKVRVRSGLVQSEIQVGTADSNGLVRFRDLPAIEVQLLTWLPGKSVEQVEWSDPRWATTTPEGQTVNVDFRFSRTTTGILTDKKGDPVRKCRVLLKEINDDGEKVIGSAHTDKKGRFLFRTPADEPGPFALVSTWTAPDGARSSIRLPGVEPGEKDLVVTFGH